MQKTNKQTIPLLSYTKPEQLTSNGLDSDAPMSFRDWYASNKSIIPEQEYNQYNQYLVSWYKDKNVSKLDALSVIRLKYLNLLSGLQIFLTDAERENWYSKVNLNDEKELLLSIPFFAKKLKTISLYYLNYRKLLKDSKLKYNLKGSNIGAVKELRELILTNYTKKTNSYITVPSSVWKNLPELSSVKDTIRIELEEYYDDHQYFDRSVDVSLSSYVDMFDTTSENFFASRGLSLSSLDWAYSSGTINISSDSFKDFTEKYLGENRDILNYTTVDGNSLKYLISNVNSLNSESSIETSSADIYEIPLQQGNNFFYFPKGVYETIAVGRPIYKGIPLSSTDIENSATSNVMISGADTIYVKTSRGVEGAWLKKEDYEIDDGRIIEGFFVGGDKTTFKYPFMGYGLSGDGLTWTGPSLKYDSQYDVLDLEYKTAVDSVYWTSNIVLSSVEDLPINKSTLAESKSYANTSYKFADKVRVFDTITNYDDSIYSGEIKEAWLYRVNETDLSISENDDSVLYWPYFKITDKSLNSVDLLPDNVRICERLQLSSIRVPFATASDHLSSSDVIYKIKNYKDKPSQATEAAWLLGSYVHKDNLISVKQLGLSVNFKAGELIRFVWTDEDTLIDQVFKSIKHENNCSYINSFNYRNNVKCECRQIQFTPFGHNGANYLDNGAFADFIAEDTVSPSEFDLNSWKGVDNKLHDKSDGFAWFKTSLSSPNWGYGKWVNGSVDGTLTLKRGQNYFYYRSIEPLQTTDDVSLPDLTVRYEYKDKSGVKWMKAKKDAEGNWKSSKTPTDMTIGEKELILYSKTPTLNFNLSGTVQRFPSNVSKNLSSIWSSYDLAVIEQSPTVVVSYPANFKVNEELLSAQYPSVRVNHISAFSWSLSSPSGDVYLTSSTTSDVTDTINFTGGGGDRTIKRYNVLLDSNSNISFVPTVTGTYTVTVTAHINSAYLSLYDEVLSNGGIYVFSDIPSISAISEKIFTTSLSSFKTPAAGFVLQTPLYGWNYSGLNGYDGKSNGARPIWATGYTDKTETNNYKGIESWGGGKKVVDIYNIITQPEISDLRFKSGRKTEYFNNNSNILWNQPITLKNFVNRKVWNEIFFDDNVTSPLSAITNIQTIIFNSRATNIPSSLVLHNFIDNKPVEIYYNAVNSFNWSISAYKENDVNSNAIEFNSDSSNLIFNSSLPQTMSSLSSKIVAQSPWSNLSNRNYPSIALIPTLEDLYTEDQSGGYFTPNNLGASVYNGKNYTYSYKTSSEKISLLGEPTNFRIGGRGLSEKDQDTSYEILKRDNSWLKEGYLTGQAAGNINRAISKKYQKFTPYQSHNETHNGGNVGLVTPSSKHSPWGGVNDSQWMDFNNHPVSFSGEVNVDIWADSQILKNIDKRIDVWCDDIFGNQYGLYKNIKGVSPINRKEVLGSIWVRKNNQFVSIGSESLSAVFSPYKNTNIYSELTGNGVRNMDVFFDTFMVETTGSIILDRIIYDYNNASISVKTNSTKSLSLAVPTEMSLSRELSGVQLSSYNYATVGDTWFFPHEKELCISLAYVSGGVLFPEIYNFDINKNIFRKSFPSDDDMNLLLSLSGIDRLIGRNVLSYSYDTKQFLFSTLVEKNSSTSLVEIYVDNLNGLSLNGVTVYNAVSGLNKVSPIILTNLNLSVPVLSTFDYPLSALNSPTSFTFDTTLDWIYINPSTGTISVTANTVGVYSIPLSVGNAYGNVGYTFKMLVNNN